MLSLNSTLVIAVKLLVSLIMGILLMTLTEVTSADSENFSSKISGQTLKVPIGAHGQSSKAFPWTGHITILSLDPVGKVKQGQDVKLTGKLLDEHGKGVKKATVEIIDDTASNSKSLILAKAITNSDGSYESEWVAKSKVSSNTIVIFAQFNGNSEYLGSVSDKIVVTVISE